MRHRSLTRFISILLTGIFLFITCVPITQAGDVVYFYHNDHLGSPLAMTDTNGEVVWERDYMPFGEEIDLQSDAANSHTYTGKEFDVETGLYYYGARYYDATIGRFISVDPADGKPEMPQTWNRYVYTLNNPYKYVDPDGELPVLVAFLIAKAVAIGWAWTGTQIAASAAGDPLVPEAIVHDYRMSDMASDIVLGVAGNLAIAEASVIGGIELGAAGIKLGVAAYPEVMVAAGTPQGQAQIDKGIKFIEGLVLPGPYPPSASGAGALGWIAKETGDFLRETISKEIEPNYYSSESKKDPKQEKKRKGVDH